jgi:hypothetical protein
MVELLEHVAAHVAAAEDGEDLEQTRDCGARAEVGRLVGMKPRLLVQELDPQECSHPLAERLLEFDESGLGRDDGELGGGVHAAILRDRETLKQTSRRRDARLRQVVGARVARFASSR